LSKQLYITECPRDAMQGIQGWIPTDQKVNYLNALLSCGFDYLDFGSFVSPKAIPQLKDTAEVLEQLNPSDTKLLAIIANERGAQEASSHDRISILGYPFSISETFQKRNTNHSLDASLKLMEEVSKIAEQNKKQLRVYLSMGFGNPYGDPWSEDLLCTWVDRLSTQFPIQDFALSDTIAVATASQCSTLFNVLFQHFPKQTFSAHFHVVQGQEQKLIQAAYEAGCQHFDTAIGGFGGCPMAKDELTGNLSTEALLAFMQTQQIKSQLDLNAFEKARIISQSIFN
jgi:hydroxymethylglutaryl-CoA lyase